MPAAYAYAVDLSLFSELSKQCKAHISNLPS